MKKCVSIQLSKIDFALMKRLVSRAIEFDIAIRQVAYSAMQGDDKDEEYERIEQLRKALEHVEGVRCIETLIIPFEVHPDLFYNLTKWTHMLAMPFSDDDVEKVDEKLREAQLN